MHAVAMLADAAVTPGADAAGSADMSIVVNAIGTVVFVVGKVWDLVVHNPFLLFGLGAAALTIGIGVFASARSSVH